MKRLRHILVRDVQDCVAAVNVEGARVTSHTETVEVVIEWPDDAPPWRYLQGDGRPACIECGDWRVVSEGKVTL